MKRMLPRLAIAWMMLVASIDVLAHGVTLELHHPLPADSVFHTRFILPWVDKVQKDSGGRLHFHVVAGEPTNAPDKLFDQVKDGSADVAWTALAYTPDRFTALEVFELPLMAKTADTANRAMWEYLRLSDAAQNALEGVRVLSIHTGTPAVIHTRNRAITSIQDAAGLKIAAATAAGRLLLEAAGASSPVIDPARIQAALAAGDIDGALLPWEALPARGLDASAKYHMEFGAKGGRLDSPVFLLVMNAATYRNLPDDLKKILQDDSGPAAAAAATKALEAAAAAARQAAIDRGDAIDMMPAGALPQWQKAAASAIDDWIKAADKRGAGGKELVDAAREAAVNQ